jgi:hypothetical protein
MALFCCASAATAPLARSDSNGTPLWMSGLIVAPQIVVALLAPWVGFHSEKRGRWPLLLIGFAMVPIRAGILAITAFYPFLLAAQILDGISGATIGVLTVIVLTDLTAGLAGSTSPSAPSGRSMVLPQPSAPAPPDSFFSTLAPTSAFCRLPSLAPPAPDWFGCSCRRRSPRSMRIEGFARRPQSVRRRVS